MKNVRVTIRQIGNSHGVVIPKTLLTQLGLGRESQAEIFIKGGALVLRKATETTREGWASAAKKIAAMRADALVLGDFGNDADAEFTW